MNWRRAFFRLFGRSADTVGRLPIEGRMPEFEGIGPWINSEPLTRETLRGQVVLVDFWTYSCVNCQRTVPFLKAWHQTYRQHGLTIIGVHTPEFEFERSEENVRSEVARLGIEFPVALDNDYRLWNRYRNHYWPAHYFVDTDGNLRAQHFGEGGYGHSEAVIRRLLVDAGQRLDFSPVSPSVEADAGRSGKLTPETYLGFNRLEYLGSPEGVPLGQPRRFTSIPEPAVNIFYLDGTWRIEENFAVPEESGARLLYRVSASQVNVVADGPDGGARVKVLLDGEPLTEKTAGVDCWPGGEHSLEIREGRMYQLIDTRSAPAEHLMEIVFLDPGVKAYSFTFG
jgi:thiol-disulfide isomerase/thioredoxin